MVPAVHYLRSRVILPLLSKSLTVGKAVCALIDAGGTPLKLLPRQERY
jgi:hypothetical protein